MAIVTGSASPSIQFGYAMPNPFVAGSPLNVPLALAAAFAASGVSAAQVDTLYAQSFDLAANAPVTIALNATSDVAGQPVAFARVRLIAWRNRSTVDGQVVTLGGAASSPWLGLAAGGAALNCYPSAPAGAGRVDGFTVWTAPNTAGAIVTSTSFNLEINPGANAVPFDLLIAGCSA